MKEVILTGLRANDELHLGNYLGGILPMVRLQKERASDYQINMFVPDLHSFTTPIDHKQLYASTIQNLRYYVAAGLNLTNPNTFLYRQSFIPAHSELTWILDCFTYMGEASRMTQFKDKSSNMSNDEFEYIIKRSLKSEAFLRHAKNDSDVDFEKFSKEYAKSIVKLIDRYKEFKQKEASVGLFNYPILMAADILLYNAKWVPVGEDQYQHLEICRDIAIRMNNKFGNLFVVPAPTEEQTKFMNLDKGLRIRDLIDPTKKMSKSADSLNSKILMVDEPQVAHKKIMSATTDNVGEINFDWNNQPGITNLLQILAILSDQSQTEVNQVWVGQTQYGDFKRVVADKVADFLTKFQADLARVDDEALRTKLIASEKAMNEVAQQTLLRVQKAVGLRK